MSGLEKKEFYKKVNEALKIYVKSKDAGAVTEFLSGLGMSELQKQEAAEYINKRAGKKVANQLLAKYLEELESGKSADKIRNEINHLQHSDEVRNFILGNFDAVIKRRERENTIKNKPAESNTTGNSDHNPASSSSSDSSTPHKKMEKTDWKWAIIIILSLGMGLFAIGKVRGWF